MATNSGKFTDRNPDILAVGFDNNCCCTQFLRVGMLGYRCKMTRLFLVFRQENWLVLVIPLTIACPLNAR